MTDALNRRGSLARDVMLGIDIGGSGSRVAISSDNGDERRELSGLRTQVRSGGSSVPELVRELIGRAASAWPEDIARIGGVGIGATGLASLVSAPADLASLATEETGALAAAAIDAVTAHLGALAGEGGAVVALGTGAIAVGHPGISSSGACPPRWRRVDGWGHLLGDRGGGAWVGRRALEQALRTQDGVDAAGAALLEACRERFGDPHGWPRLFYTRADRAGLLAELAVDVVGLAHDGNPAAHQLLTDAGAEAARSALAALDADYPAQIVLTGGLVRAGGSLEDGFLHAVTARRDDVIVRQPDGEPLEGALRLARLASAGQVAPQKGFIWS